MISVNIAAARDLRHAARRIEEARSRLVTWNEAAEAIKAAMPDAGADPRGHRKARARIDRIDHGPLERAELDLKAWWERLGSLMRDSGIEVLIVAGRGYAYPLDDGPYIADDPMFASRFRADRLANLDSTEGG